MPPVFGAEYDEIVEVSLNEADESDTIQILETDPDAVTFEYDEEYSQGGIEPPSNVSIISQTVKVGSGGTATVDIVLEIEDVGGASEYEKRESVA